MTAQILRRHCDPQCDFLGHIGGDDFVIIFQSTDWEAKCKAMLDAFAEAIPAYHADADIKRGGYMSEDRSGKTVFFPIVGLSLGTVVVDPSCYDSHYQVAAATADAKKEAKTIPGSSMFVERRKAIQPVSIAA
jgi:GGDEF domain-containing protein